jgi:hypothetical protein
MRQKKFGGPGGQSAGGKEIQNGSVDAIEIEGEGGDHEQNFKTDQNVGQRRAEEKQLFIFVFAFSVHPQTIPRQEFFLKSSLTRNDTFSLSRRKYAGDLPCRPWEKQFAGELAGSVDFC